MISIIVPVYNVKTWLPDCIASCLRLKLPTELILVDDGSEDGSAGICDNAAAGDPRIRVIHQKNGGLSAARNSGIREARGEYLLFLDADDFLNSAETELLAEEIRQSGEDLGAGLYRKYFEQSRRFEPEDASSLEGLSGAVPIEDFLRAVPRDGEDFYMIACRFIVRRTFLLENRLFFAEGLYHEDEEWTARLLCAADRIYIGKSFFYEYRQTREGAITSSLKPKHVRDKMTILQTLDTLRENSGSSIKKAYVSGRMAQIYRSLLLYNGMLSGCRREELICLLKKMKGCCRPYMAGRSGRIAGLLLDCFGVSGTCLLLRLRKAGESGV